MIRHSEEFYRTRLEPGNTSTVVLFAVTIIGLLFLADYLGGMK